MKKTLAVIIALLLCTALILTVTACGNKDPFSTVTEAQIKAQGDALQSWLDDWTLSHAQDEDELSDQSKTLRKDLNGEKVTFSFFSADGEDAFEPVFNASYDKKAKEYSVTASWNDGAVIKDAKSTAKTATFSHWAGKYSKTTSNGYDLIEDDDAASSTVDEIVTALVATVNDITGQAVTGKFSASGSIGVEVLDKSYGLQVKGNVDIKKKADTEVGIVVTNRDTGAVLGGIYYDAAAKSADNKLYIQYPYDSDEDNDDKLERDDDGNLLFKYKMIPYADIIAISTLEGKVKDNANDGAWYADRDIEGLADLLDAFGATDASGMVGGILDMVARAYANADGRYLIDVNLGDVMSKVKTLLSGITVDLDILDAIGLDLNTMHGLQGHVSISAKYHDTSLSEVEIAVNIPECDFYFSNKADARKISIPSISFAIYLDDLTFSADELVKDVIPDEAKEEAVFFSPTNIDLSGDVTIKHETPQDATDKELFSTFHYDLVSDINPLEVAVNKLDSQARAVLMIRQTQGNTFKEDACTNFLTITYEQGKRLLTASGTAFKIEGDDGSKLYTFEMKTTKDGKVVDMTKDEIINELKDWLGILNWWGLEVDPVKGIVINDKKTNSKGELVGPAKPSAKAIFENDLVKKIMEYYQKKYKEALDEREAEKKAKETAGKTAPAGFSVSDIGDYVNAFIDLYNEFKKDGKIVIDFEEEFSAHVDLGEADMAKIIKAINDNFIVKAENKLPVDPKLVKVEVNYGETYKDKVCISVNYKDTTYELTFDDSVDKHFGITFKMAIKGGRSYTFDFDAEKGIITDSSTKWDVDVIFEIKDSKDATVEKTTITLKDFHGKWGIDTSARATALIGAAKKDKTEGGEIFPHDGTGPATQLADGLLKLLSKDEKVESLVEKIGEFVVRQVVNSQMAKLDKAEKEAQSANTGNIANK